MHGRHRPLLPLGIAVHVTGLELVGQDADGGCTVGALPRELELLRLGLGDSAALTRAATGTPPFEKCDDHQLLAEQLGVGTVDLFRIEMLGSSIVEARYSYAL